MSSDYQSLRPTAQQILAYLSRHPDAHDTVGGIASWWLMEETIRASLVETQAALDELVTAGFVVLRTGADGKSCYRINPERLVEIQASCKSQRQTGLAME